ncbi:hypothetical protein TNCV_2126661 [Trichonephila clavipes]|nr:hypothetical protein TNCV_2126661 [Trichonephila clavipes]
MLAANATKRGCNSTDADKTTWIHLKKLYLTIRVSRFVVDHTTEDAHVKSSRSLGLRAESPCCGKHRRIICADDTNSWSMARDEDA